MDSKTRKVGDTEYVYVNAFDDRLPWVLNYGLTLLVFAVIPLIITLLFSL